MGYKKVDKDIKMKINSPEQVPDNINRIFDKFIDENIQTTKSTKRAKRFRPRFSLPQRIATAVASVATTMVAGGVIYAAVTGNSVLELFNVNKDKYNEDLVTINEEVTSNDITLVLQDYAIDHNAIIVNYSITSDKELNFDENEYIKVDTTANDDIKLDITQQNYAADNEAKIYKISTLYAIEQFESTLDKFILNIHVKEIAGIEGNWNYSIEMDKSNKEENRTYSFNHTETRNAPRIPLKTNYIPISMSVDNMSVSDFSTLINTTIFNGQEGVEEDKQIEPKNPNGITAKRENPEKWNEVIPLIFEVKDENGNILCTIEHNYERGEIAYFDHPKIIFPNIEKDVKLLTLNIYSNYGEKEFLGKFDLDISESVDTSSSRYELDTERKIGNVSLKYSSEWKCDTDEKHSNITVYTHDEFGELISIDVSELSSFSKDEEGYYIAYTDCSDINKTMEECNEFNKRMYDEFEILDQGEEKIGIFDGVQSTVKTRVRDSIEEEKSLYAIVNGKTYCITFRCKPETYNNYYEYFVRVVQSIEVD